jgi:hypothetical protein
LARSLAGSAIILASGDVHGVKTYPRSLALADHEIVLNV